MEMVVRITSTSPLLITICNTSNMLRTQMRWYLLMMMRGWTWSWSLSLDPYPQIQRIRMEIILASFLI
jgi:hypothetical protein